MPAGEADSVLRGARPLTALFWAGVGLAPLAGLLLLIGGGGALRVAAVLAVVSVVLIGLSVALRPDINAVRLQLEETLLEEIDTLREDVREDIATAARATHQSFGERVGGLQQQVEALRAGRAAAPRAAAPRAAVPPPPPPPVADRGGFPPPYAVAPQSAVPRSAVPQSAVPRSAVPQSAVPRSAVPRSAVPQSAVPRSAVPRSAVPSYPAPPPPVSAPAAPASGRHLPPPMSAPAAPNGRAAVESRRGTERRPRQQEDGPRRAPTGRANVPPGGVYRHTETVQVTTRSTSYVDDPPGETGYGRRSAEREREPDWSVPRSRDPAEYEESWTDRKLRERYGRRPRPYDADDDESWRRDTGEGRWPPVSAQPVSPDPISSLPISSLPISGEPVSRSSRRSRRWDEDDDDSPGVRIGERWAAVRSDDRGRELEVGERRAARHRDDTGTELRMEDRWAAVRQDDSGIGNGNGSHGRNGYDSGRNGYDSDRSGLDGGRHGGGHRDHSGEFSQPDLGQPDFGRPALPAGSSEPSWNDSWDEPAPVREPRGRRHRSDDEPSEPTTSRRRRRLDFELSDDRWR